MTAFLRCEVWTAFVCDSGARVAIIGRPDIIRLTSTQRVTHEDSLSLVVALQSAAVDEIAIGRVLQLVYDDGSFEEWRIHQVDDRSGRNRGEFRVQCRSILYELRDAAVVTTTTGTSVAFGKTFDGVNAETVIDYLLTILPSWWDKGTITPTAIISFTVADASPLAVLRTLVTACGAAGSMCELDVRQNGTSGYYLDLVSEIGGTATGADIRTNKNILTSERSRSRETQVTRIYPTVSGTPAPSYVYWRVISISGTDVEIRQAETDAPAIAFDDQLNGLYLENDAGTKTLITASVASTSTVTVASATGYSVGEWCRVVADSSGTDLMALDVPGASPVKVGIYEAGGDLITNLCNNPFLSRWTGSTSAAPVGWTVTTGTVSRNSNATYIRRGLYSMRLQYSGGIVAQTATQNVVPGRGAIYSAKFTAYVAVGGLGVSLRNQSGTVLATTTVGTGWQEIEFTNVNVGAATGLYLYCSYGVAGADTYVDSAQITWGATQAAWTQGCNPSLAWTRANMQLADTASDPTTYTFTVADLATWSADDWPYDALTLGATVTITDTDLGITTTSRIQELQRDHLNPLATTVVLERQTRTLTTRLAAAA